MVDDVAKSRFQRIKLMCMMGLSDQEMYEWEKDRDLLDEGVERVKGVLGVKDEGSM